MSVLFDILYALVAILASPWLLYRRVVQKKPIAGWRTKLTGHLQRRHPEQPCVWFHAVSVGEVLQLQSLIPEFVATHPDYEVVITTTTGTGFDVARQKFPQQTITYWPFDFRHVVQRALTQVRPSLVVLVELELWPNFLRAAHNRQIPVVVINGRMSERSFGGYRRLRWLVRPMLSSLSQVAAQSTESAERFRTLGVPADRVITTGNIKYDRIQSLRCNPRTLELRTTFQIEEDAIVWIVGSTQSPEEALALDAYEVLAREFPQLRLILVPRHQERFEEVARLVQSREFPLLRRSQPSPRVSQRPVLLLDTLGELAACWGLADIAFVGGSLSQRGGQNLLEPAGYGAAVVVGPNTWNFRQIVEDLRRRNALLTVHDGAELLQTTRELLVRPEARLRLGRAGQEFVLTQQGATRKTLDVIEAALPTSVSSRQSAA